MNEITTSQLSVALRFFLKLFVYVLLVYGSLRYYGVLEVLS